MLVGSQDHDGHEMNDRATPDEQPPYWQNAEAMDFRELLKFYDHAWEALSDLDPEARTSST